MKIIHQLKMASVLSVALATGAFAQDQKKFNIYLNIDKNGDQVTIDTSFATREEMESFMKSEGYDVPEMSELPELSDLKDQPGMKQVIIDIDDSQFSKEDKAKMRAEMQIEMEKAQLEMQKANKEMKKADTEKQKAEQEMRKVKIEISEEDNGDGKKLMLRKSESKDGGGEEVTVIPPGQVTESSDGKFKIIRIESKDGDQKNIRVIHKSVSDVQTEKQLDRKVVAPVEMEEKPAHENKVSDDFHVLNAADFKIYPNPTQGKINVSFRVENDGPVEVKLLDASGKQLIDEEVTVSNGVFNKEYNIEGHSRGTYLLQLRQGNQWRHEKIVMR